MPGWLAEAADRVVASDPGLTRLWTALSATAGMASALGVEFVFAEVTDAGAMGTLIAMLLGAVVAMMGSMALGGTGTWVKIRTAVFFPVALGVGMVIGVFVASRTDLMLGIFVAVMFAAVFVRRFGVPFFFYGFMGWMGYFFASFLHATVQMLPTLLADVTVASAWVLLLSTTVLRGNPTRTLRSTVRAFGARARAVTRACADLLEATSTASQDRARRRLRAQQARLAEAALMVEGWSAEQGAMPADRSATALRRALIDAQHVLDRLASASDSLVTSPSDTELVAAAARVADRLARRDDSGASDAARALAEAAERAADAGRISPAAWWPARHFAVAALDLVALTTDGEDPDDDSVVEFEAVVGLAFGNLPGSPAVAADVPARHVRWNPLSRLNLVNRQAIQVAVAGGLAILAGRELSTTRYYWAVLAAFIMFTGTATRSETAIKGLNRVLGTLLGLFASIGVAELTAGNTAAVLTAIVASMFCGFYLIRVSYAYMIFFITIMLGQLYSVLHEFSPGLLVLRLEETAIGAAVGLIVSIVVTPLSTRDTVRAARNGLLVALADLLDAVAAQIGGEPSTASVDALSRTLDDRLRQLALVARPLTRPFLVGNSPPRTRHRLALYAALATHARALAIGARTPVPCPEGPVAASRALAAAVTRLSETPIGRPQPAAAGPLADADAALFARSPLLPGAQVTDPVPHALIRIQDVLCELTKTPALPERVPVQSTTSRS